MAGNLHEGNPRYIPESEVSPQERWDFSKLAAQAANIYEAHDLECGYGPDTMMTKLLSNAATLQRITERDPENPQAISKSLTNVFIWTITVANYGKLGLFEPVAEKFAFGCPRCHGMPCDLAEEKPCVKNPSRPWGNVPGEIPVRLDEWQNHLAKLYPNNYKGSPVESLRNTSTRLLAEAIELMTSTEPSVQQDMNALSHHDTSDSILRPWRGEFADVLAWGFAVAEALNRLTGDYSIEEAIRKTYEKGCPYCKSPKCVCPREVTILEELHKWEPL